MKKPLLLLLTFTLFSFANAQVGFDLPGSFGIDIGVHGFSSAPSQFSTNLLQSRGISLYYKYDIPLGGNPKFTFNPGLGVTWEGYVTKNDYAYSVSNDQLYLAPATEVFDAKSFDKTKISATYLDVPIEFQFRTNPSRKAFRVGLGGKVGYLISSHVKYKFEDQAGNDRKVKDKTDFGLTKIRYGLTGRIGYGPVNLFAYMGLNQFFDTAVTEVVEGDILVPLPKAEDMKSFTVGITISAL